MHCVGRTYMLGAFAKKKNAYSFVVSCLYACNNSALSVRNLMTFDILVVFENMSSKSKFY
jgi:hypothetical protein